MTALLPQASAYPSSASFFASFTSLPSLSSFSSLVPKGALTLLATSDAPGITPAAGMERTSQGAANTLAGFARVQRTTAAQWELTAQAPGEIASPGKSGPAGLRLLPKGASASSAPRTTLRAIASFASGPVPASVPNSLLPIADKGQPITPVPAPCIDAQCQRQAAASLEQAEQRQADALATLVHELRHPLAALSSGLAVLLRLEGSNPLLAGQMLQVMERQLGQMVRLIDQVEDAALMQGNCPVALSREAVSLTSIVEQAVETSRPLIDAARHELQLELPKEPLMLQADPARLVQVLVNLLSNAAKYTPAGGRITVSVRQEASDIVLVVTDSGIGIPAASLEAVFEPYHRLEQRSTAPQSGLGIGLSLVRRLVEMHGGTVTASSAGLDQGSTFTVQVPLALQT